MLVGLGVRELSVGPRAVAGVKAAVRRLDTAGAAATAAAALACAAPAEVRALLQPDTQRQEVRTQTQR